MRASVRRFAVLTVVIALLSGCGGGGGSSVAPHPGASSPAGGSTGSTSSTGRATLTMSVHPLVTTSSATRRPQYVSPTTQSVIYTVTSVNGSPVTGQTSVEQDLVSGAAGCTTSGGTVTCVTQVNVPVGTVTFSVQTYSQTGGAGTLLGNATATATILANVANTVTLTISGIIAQVLLFLATPQFTTGTAATSLLVAVPLDANGNQIVNPGSYDQPIQLALSGGSGHIGFLLDGATTATSTATIASPNDQVLVKYDGTTGISAATILASVAETPAITAAATVGIGSTTLSGTATGTFAQSRSLAFTAAGQTAAITLSGGVPPYITTSDNTSVASASYTGSTGADVTVITHGFGSTLIHVSDSASPPSTFTIPVSVTAAPILFSITSCGVATTCTATSATFAAPPINPGNQTVTLGLSGGTGTYPYVFASTGTTTSACDLVTVSGNQFRFVPTGACSDLVEFQNGNSTAYYSLEQTTGTSGLSLISTFHAYSPTSSPTNLVIADGGQATIGLSNNGPWSAPPSGSSCGSVALPSISGNTLTITASVSTPTTCSLSVSPTTGSGPIAISLDLLPKLSAAVQTFAFHHVSSLDRQSVVLSNYSSGGLAIGSGSITVPSGSGVISLDTFTSGVLTFNPTATGTALISVKDTNLDEKLGLAVNVDNGYLSALPAGIGLLSSANGGSPSTITLASSADGVFTSAAPTMTPSFIGTVSSFSAISGVTTISPGSPGTGTLTFTDPEGGTVSVPVTSFFFAFSSYGGSAIAATALEAFTATGETDTVTATGPAGDVSATSSDPLIVSTSGGAGGQFTVTSNQAGTATITVTDLSNGASTSYPVSVSSLTVPVLGHGRRTH